MRLQIILISSLLLAAVFSGTKTGLEQWAFVREWQGASPEERDDIRYGISAPVVVHVRQSVPEGDRILLRAGLDPALLPYALFPRRIFQMGVDPETNAIFMDLPPSSYPRRPPESFTVEWYLLWHSANCRVGGELTPASPRYPAGGG